jgi:hypothetical protein
MSSIDDTPKKPVSAAERRAVNKLIKRNGDHCTLCRKAFGSVTPVEGTTYGFTDEGTAAIVCDACINKLARVIGVGAYIAKGYAALNFSTEEPAWKADDRAWFAAHRDRSHRWRPTFPEEAVEQPDQQQVTLVRQLEPGRRQRVRIHSTDGIGPPDDEDVLHAAFDLFIAGPAGEKVTPAEIDALARVYRAGKGRPQ